MGMYTGLRGKVKLKAEVEELMLLWLYDDDSSCDEQYDYNMWFFIGSKLDNTLILNFADDSRATMIPRGSICYMPDDWQHENNIELGDTWNFCCSLKNYNGTIQKFIDLLPEIAVSWDLEELYEEDNVPTIHKSGE